MIARYGFNNNSGSEKVEKLQPIDPGRPFCSCSGPAAEQRDRERRRRVSWVEAMVGNFYCTLYVRPNARFTRLTSSPSLLFGLVTGQFVPAMHPGAQFTRRRINCEEWHHLQQEWAKHVSCRASFPPQHGCFLTTIYLLSALAADASPADRPKRVACVHAARPVRGCCRCPCGQDVR